ncbi:MAG: response regulator [Thermoanaerobaculia bacterium]
MPQVLCADDDPAIRALCAAALSKAGYGIDEATNGREVLEKIKSHRYAAILLDLSMPFVHGTTLLAVLEREQPESLCRVIVLTGAPEGVLEGLSKSVSAVLRKPVELNRLLSTVNDCCSNDQTVVSR